MSACNLSPHSSLLLRRGIRLGAPSRASSQHSVLEEQRTLVRQTQQQVRAGLCTTSSAEAALSTEEEEGKSDEYSTEMQGKMGGFLTYRHEDGMNFARVLDDVLVGSCLQSPKDLERLVDEENVGSIVCLQQDSDMEYFALDIQPILARAHERGDVRHIHYRINDFDAFDLRMKLPGAAVAVAKEVAQGRKVYIHCTAGLGRAPATALAYMYWYRDFTLEDAFDTLKAVRPCNPRLHAVRQATCDILFDSGRLTLATIALAHAGGPSRHIQVAGLDFGWGNPQDMQWDSNSKRHTLQRNLPPGKYPYKFIFEDRWTTSADHPTLQDGDNVNNYIEVVGDVSDPRTVEARKRLLSEGGCLTEAERQQLKQQLETTTY